MPKKILVTGGCGFIGSHLVDRLVAEGHQVMVLDNLEHQVHRGKIPAYLNSDARYFYGDMRDEDALRRAIIDVEVIFHEASVVGVGQSMYEVKRYVDANTLGTAKLLELLVKDRHKVEKLVVASSMSIYGEGCYSCPQCGVVHTQLRSSEQLEKRDWEMRCPHCGGVATPVATGESKPLVPTSIYAITKRDQEEMCLAIGRAYNIPTVALRYFNAYGPRQSLDNPYTGVAAIFSSRIKNGNPPLVFEDGLQSRDFIDVADIVQANLLVMERTEADYQVFNVGTGRPVTIYSLSHLMSKLHGSDIEASIQSSYRSGDIRHCYADISKIQKLGFDPMIKLEEGMASLVNWAESTEAEDNVEEARRELQVRGLVK